MSALDQRCFYSFECNRCATSASDSSRTGIELFSAHHMQTMHAPFANQPRRTEIRSPLLDSRPELIRRARSLRRHLRAVAAPSEAAR